MVWTHLNPRIETNIVHNSKKNLQINIPDTSFDYHFMFCIITLLTWKLLSRKARKLSLTTFVHQGIEIAIGSFIASRSIICCNKKYNDHNK